MLRSTERRSPTPESFHQLLAWLDAGTDSGGQRYLEMRRRLVVYFERKRCDLPDALADETLNRVARRLAEEGALEGAPAHYCYIVARFVFHEYLRDAARQNGAIADHARATHKESLTDREPDPERLLACLDTCLERLSEADRDLIVEYYRGDRRRRIEQRKLLAARLGLTANALMIRASRIRVRLEQCVSDCRGHDRPVAVSSQPIK